MRRAPARQSAGERPESSDPRHRRYRRASDDRGCYARDRGEWRGVGGGGEGSDHEGGEAARGGDPGGRRADVNASVGQEHEDQVVDDEVGPQPADVLRSMCQCGNGFQCVFAFGGEIQRVRKGGREGFGEASAASVQCEELLDHEAEASPRVRLRESLVHHGPAGVHLFRERLGGQDLLGREAPIQRGRADSRAAGDLAHRHVQALGREQGASRFQDAFAVVAGIGAQGLRQIVGHHSHFS